MEILFDLASLEKKIEELEKKQEADDFWNDSKKAQNIIKETNISKNLLNTYKENDKALKMAELTRGYPFAFKIASL